MRKLYKFGWDCGRMGFVEGIFVADDSEVRAAIGREVHFGEILGKHSEVYGPLAEGEITELSDDSLKIDWLISVFSAKPDGFLDVPSESITISGHNPLQYLKATDEEEATPEKSE